MLGGAELAQGHRAAAVRAHETAVGWNPYSTAALGALARMARHDGEMARVHPLCRKVRAVTPGATCPGR